MIAFTITAEAVRNACIRNKWYTFGTTKDYEEMLNEATWCNMMPEDAEIHIYRLMTDIRTHSDTERMKRESGLDYAEIGEHIAHTLLNACTICFD